MIELSSQSPAARLYVALSVLAIAITGLLAGGLLLFAEHAMADFDFDTTSVFQTIASWGLIPLVGLWLIYMFSVAVFFGYRTTENRAWALIIVFLLALLYNLFVVVVALDTIMPICRGVTVM